MDWSGIFAAMAEQVEQHNATLKRFAERAKFLRLTHYRTPVSGVRVADAGMLRHFRKAPISIESDCAWLDKRQLRRLERAGKKVAKSKVGGSRNGQA